MRMKSAELFAKNEERQQYCQCTSRAACCGRTTLARRPRCLGEQREVGELARCRSRGEVVLVCRGVAGDRRAVAARRLVAAKVEERVAACWRRRQRR